MHLLCVVCICCIWWESSRGALEWKSGSGAEWSYYDTRDKHLHSSSFFCVSLLPCCSALNQPGCSSRFSSCLFFFFALFSFSIQSLIRLSSCASMNQCTSAFMFLLILTFCIFILCLPGFFNRQPSCSPGKISLTAQCKSPSSMITRAYYKTLDKCQRGLRGGDLEDIWRRDRPALTVAHTQHQVQNKQA